MAHSSASPGRRRLHSCLLFAFFGVWMPVAATLMHGALTDADVSFAAALAFQRSMPLLWLIDTTPVVLGALGWLLGAARERQAELLAEVHSLLDVRTTELAGARRDVDRLLDWMADGFIVVDHAGVVRRANASAISLLGTEGSPLVGRELVELVDIGRDELSAFDGCDVGALRTGVHNGGTVALSASPVFDDAGQRTGTAYVVHDLSAQLATERRLESTLANLPHFVVIASTKGVIHMTNQVEDETHDERVGGKLWEFVSPEQRAIVRSACRRAVGTTRAVSFATTSYGSDGEEQHFLNRVGPILDRNDVTGLVMIKRDVTAERRAEQVQRRLATAVEQASDSIMITDPLGAIVYVNPAFEAVSGYSAAEAIGQSPNMLKSGHQSAEVYSELWRTIGRGDVWTGRLENRAKSGDIFIEDVRITPLVDDQARIEYFLAVKHDVTDDLARDAQRSLGQKLESIGQLAAGIAHEINTPAQYVSDNTAFLQRAFDKIMGAVDAGQDLLDRAGAGALDDAAIKTANTAYRRAKLGFLRDEVPKAIEQSLEGLSRVSKIVGAMKEFSHPSAGSKESVDIAQVIDTTITVARNEWKYVARLDTDFDDDLPLVPCLRDELSQVVLNIVVNAAHAISAVTDGGAAGLGTISIATRCDGDHAVLTIADSGGGMPPQVRARVFDPFFTTKPVGKGTGQGLAIAHNVVVDKHGGAIDVDSEVGVGTTFTIRLPLAEARVRDGADEVAEEVRDASAVR